MKGAQGAPRKKLFEIFNGLFDYSAGALQSGFYPQSIGGIAKPPINIARTADGNYVTPSRTLELSAAWACTWLIADTIASLPFILNQREAGKAYGVPATLNPVYSVLGRNPNSAMGAMDFWQFMIASELLWGNAYAQKSVNKAGDVVALAPMLPQFTIPYKDGDSGLIRYKYIPTGLLNDPQQDFAASEVFHLKDRTLDGLTGLSRIEYARNSLGIARAGEAATSDIFRNGMRSNGFLMYDKTLKPEQRVEIRSSLERFKTGGPDAAGFMVLEGGMNFSQLSMSPLDTQLLSSRQFSVEDVCRWFGVPPVLIGHANVTSWGTGVEQLLIGFISLTLRPYIRKIEQTVQRQLVKPADQASCYLTIDTDDLMGADSAARSTLYSQAGQNGWMTRNEIRAKEDLPPMDGGDELTVQSNLIPLGKLGELGGQPSTHTPPPAAKAAA